jgi:hypothetical protein
MYGGGSVILITLLSNFGVSDFARAANFRYSGALCRIRQYLCFVGYAMAAVSGVEEQNGQSAFLVKESTLPLLSKTHQKFARTPTI